MEIAGQTHCALKLYHLTTGGGDFMSYVKPTIKQTDVSSIVTPMACTTNFTCTGGFDCSGYTCKSNFKCTGW